MGKYCCIRNSKFRRDLHRCDITGRHKSEREDWTCHTFVLRNITSNLSISFLIHRLSILQRSIELCMSYWRNMGVVNITETINTNLLVVAFLLQNFLWHEIFSSRALYMYFSSGGLKYVNLEFVCKCEIYIGYTTHFPRVVISKQSKFSEIEVSSCNDINIELIIYNKSYIKISFVSLLSHFWLIHFSPTPALSTISRPLSSYMCSITPETAKVGSSYSQMRGPGFGCWFSAISMPNYIFP